MKRTKFNILFTCIGRRVSLLESFRLSAKKLKLDTEIIGADTTELSPALEMCDHKHVVHHTEHPKYLSQLLSITKEHKVKLLIPTTDHDLLLLAQNKKKFEKLGCFVHVSAPEVIEICQNKKLTHKFLKKNSFGTPDTIAAATALRKKNFKYPCFMKPWDGSASKFIQIAANREELSFYARHIENCIVQDFAEGDEYTCDVFVDFDGEVRCVVPRKRLEVRSGEVSKGRIEKVPEIITQVRELVKALNAGPGVVTVQLMYSGKDHIKFIEINPRFGGGAPLSIKAGANFPKWILTMLSTPEKTFRATDDCYKDKLTMLRYDAEVWV